MKLSNDRILQIESMAEGALQSAYGLTSISSVAVPVDLKKVLTYFGITLKSADFTQPDLIGVAGAFSRADKVIYIPQDDIYQRISFTVAHEIGHFVLHADMPNEVFYRTQADLITPAVKEQEMEANWFAASLLMPRELIIKYRKLYGNDVDLMKVMFGVSRAAMQYRLNHIK